MSASPVRATVDFDKPGKQTGFLDLPYSPHGDAWGTIRIPLAVIANGKGPTVIFEGGNHGDEYEGPIALGEVIMLQLVRSDESCPAIPAHQRAVDAIQATDLR